MKRIILSLALAFAGLSCAMAQVSLKFGAVAGLNMTRLNGDAADFLRSFALNGEKADYNYGFFVGPKMTLNSALGLGMDAALIYNMRNIGLFKTNDDNLKKTMHSVELPVNARYTFSFNEFFGIFAFTGPQVGLNIKDKSSNETTLEAFNKSFERKNLTFSWNVGVGFKIVKHLELGVGYNIGLTDAFEVPNKETLNKIAEFFGGKKDAFNTRANTLTVSAAFVF